MPVRALTVALETIQSGSGDPSPTNIRPLSGRISTSISTTDGSNIETVNITFGQTVYGGVVDFKTGILSITWEILALGSLSWSYDPVAHQMVCSNMGGHIKTQSGIKCDRYKTQEITSWAQLNNNSIARHPDDDNVIRVYDTVYTDATTFKTAMQNANAQFCYELVTPQIIQLIPDELTMLKGNNSVSGDGVITITALTGDPWS